MAKSNYRQNYYVDFKIVGTNEKTTNEITIGLEVTTNAITNNRVAFIRKKGDGNKLYKDKQFNPV